MVEQKFDDSLPAFVAAFTRHHSLSEKDIREIQGMLEAYRRKNGGDDA